MLTTNEKTKELLTYVKVNRSLPQRALPAVGLSPHNSAGVDCCQRPQSLPVQKSVRSAKICQCKTEKNVGRMSQRRDNEDPVFRSVSHLSHVRERRRNTNECNGTIISNSRSDGKEPDGIS
ncbi:hypothetical protein EVAR_45868_1 [Eumeta japonica]|uniref:Uncharacterized protein n=1 Tax=Eumeta variegata TaxID=151549 RepID=A0A4C1WKQ2_EUMVA|nr:hypothetical protein EVAR_45868_1 [Eumeta japonica]